MTETVNYFCELAAISFALVALYCLLFELPALLFCHVPHWFKTLAKRIKTL